VQLLVVPALHEGVRQVEQVTDQSNPAKHCLNLYLRIRIGRMSSQLLQLDVSMDEHFRLDASLVPLRHRLGSTELHWSFERVHTLF
jgi:hypothetical protein